MKKLVKSMLSGTSSSIRRAEQERQIEELKSVGDDVLELALKYNGAGKSHAQLKQDIFALMVNGWKKNGFFVEFGATNGIDLSNTHLLEKSYGWTGILAEPATMWHDALKANRDAHIELYCVWKESGATLTFDMVDAGEFSTLSEFSDGDMHRDVRKSKSSYEVNTISLLDMLRKYDAPKVIDYMSVDTEGSEFEILKGFDFSEYQINVLTIEHNFTPLRADIHELLTRNGYKRVLESVSKWDDWYVHRSL